MPHTHLCTQVHARGHISDPYLPASVPSHWLQLPELVRFTPTEPRMREEEEDLDYKRKEGTIASCMHWVFSPGGHSRSVLRNRTKHL